MNEEYKAILKLIQLYHETKEKKNKVIDLIHKKFPDIKKENIKFILDDI